MTKFFETGTQSPENLRGGQHAAGFDMTYHDLVVDAVLWKGLVVSQKVKASPSPKHAADDSPAKVAVEVAEASRT